MTDSGQLDFLDLISIMSFVIAVINLDEEERAVIEPIHRKC